VNVLEITSKFRYYSMPWNGAEAEAEMERLLMLPEPSLVEMYGLTDQTFFAKVLASDAAGCLGEMLLDESEYSGPTENRLVRAMCAQLKHWRVTIVTAGPGAQKPSCIAHRKRVMNPRSGQVVTGSVNASIDGFYSQTNDMFSFTSYDYVQQEAPLFYQHRDWSRLRLASKQVMP
jgi:hypothetical protein